MKLAPQRPDQEGNLEKRALRWLCVAQALLAIKPNLWVLSLIFGPLALAELGKDPANSLFLFGFAMLGVVAPITGFSYARRLPRRGALWVALAVNECLLFAFSITAIASGQATHAFATADTNGCHYRGPGDVGFCGVSDVMTSATGWSWLPVGMEVAAASALLVLVLLVRRRAHDPQPARPSAPQG